MIIIRLFNLLQKETENWLPATILCTLKEVIRFIKKQFTIDMFQFSWINILYTTKKYSILQLFIFGSLVEHIHAAFTAQAQEFVYIFLRINVKKITLSSQYEINSNWCGFIWNLNSEFAEILESISHYKQSRAFWTFSNQIFSMRIGQCLLANVWISIHQIWHVFFNLVWNLISVSIVLRMLYAMPSKKTSAVLCHTDINIHIYFK